MATDFLHREVSDNRRESLDSDCHSQFQITKPAWDGPFKSAMLTATTVGIKADESIANRLSFVVKLEEWHTFVETVVVPAMAVSRPVRLDRAAQFGTTLFGITF